MVEAVDNNNQCSLMNQGDTPQLVALLSQCIAPLSNTPKGGVQEGTYHTEAEALDVDIGMLEGVDQECTVALGSMDEDIQQPRERVYTRNIS